jgi:ABC-type Fe3+/spermidine/putrescine transport system ATPase subunit
LKAKKYKKDVINRKVSNVSGMLGISHLLSRGVKNLSGGEKQRVALARAIVTDPAILLLDEPLSKLDAKMAQSLGRELEEVHNELGITMIQVTHNHAEALMNASRIGVINKGAVVQMGSPEEVFYSPKSKFVADFVDMENVFDGRIISVNGSPVIRTPDFEVELPYLEIGEGSVTIGIRPEDIELVADPCRNALSGRVVDIHPSGSALYRVYVEVGNAVFVVDLGRRYASDIISGSSVNMYLRPDAIRIIS